MAKLEFTDWSRVHSMFRCGENAILPRKVGLTDLSMTFLQVLSIERRRSRISKTFSGPETADGFKNTVTHAGAKTPTANLQTVF